MSELQHMCNCIGKSIEKSKNIGRFGTEKSLAEMIATGQAYVAQGITYVELRRMAKNKN